MKGLGSDAGTTSAASAAGWGTLIANGASSGDGAPAKLVRAVVCSGCSTARPPHAPCTGGRPVQRASAPAIGPRPDGRACFCHSREAGFRSVFSGAGSAGAPSRGAQRPVFGSSESRTGGLAAPLAGCAASGDRAGGATRRSAKYRALVLPCTGARGSTREKYRSKGSSVLRAETTHSSAATTCMLEKEREVERLPFLLAEVTGGLTAVMRTQRIRDPPSAADPS